ncbi:hypothetical protein SAMN05216228_10932 [Rhizobium tibeticum]|uniref:Nodulation protein O n=1 Tax=Rhizobium tibeticum TaxID=501024 RepID=A0A1H8X298_9HYPH|nr:hypothetical protein [Rhizobium tibeticum]SEI22180.1 Nodulation protein O [Rhizobium tibeticum]SEP33996.1 hypothetical protein SAMN05216228_10932 [Rhizobium tibeticum]
MRQQGEKAATEDSCNGRDKPRTAGEDNDKLYGGPGDDVLYAGDGRDYLTGVADHDTFVFAFDAVSPDTDGFGANIINNASQSGYP